MTVWKLEHQPDTVTAVWVSTAAGTVRYDRDPAETRPDCWVAATDGHRLTWPQVRGRGDVTDDNPDDVSWLPAGPFHAREGTVFDGDGKAAMHHAATVAYGDRVAALVARLLNDHVRNVRTASAGRMQWGGDVDTDPADGESTAWLPDRFAARGDAAEGRFGCRSQRLFNVHDMPNPGEDGRLAALIVDLLNRHRRSSGAPQASADERRQLSEALDLLERFVDETLANRLCTVEGAFCKTHYAPLVIAANDCCVSRKVHLLLVAAGRRSADR